tara:strand:- start:146 stop:337 length:192 start_codon:yes stop_codon:yes gene_type:complete
MKDYKIKKDWQFSASKLFKKDEMVCLNDDLAKIAMKEGYIENPKKKKSKKIKEDGGTNSTANN